MQYFSTVRNVESAVQSNLYFGPEENTHPPYPNFCHSTRTSNPSFIVILSYLGRKRSILFRLFFT